MNNKYNNGLAGPKELRIGMNGRGGDPNNRMAQRASAQKPKNGRKTFMRLLAYIRKYSLVLGTNSFHADSHNL